MKSNWRAFALAVIAAGFCLGQSTTAEAGCVGLNGTADGVNKTTAVSRSQNALATAVQEFKASKRIRNVRISPMRPKPQPYWRSSVSPAESMRQHCRSSRLVIVALAVVPSANRPRWMARAATTC